MSNQSYIGPWDLDSDPAFGGLYWRPPEGAITSADYRGEDAIEGNDPEGNVGIFTGPFGWDPGPEYDPISNTILTANDKITAARALKLPVGQVIRNFHGGLDDFHQWVRTRYGDPFGKRRWRPRMPKFGEEISTPQLRLLRVIYTKLRQKWQAEGGTKFYLKWLGAMVRKLHESPNFNVRSVQNGHPPEHPLSPDTEVLDSFNQPNSSWLDGDLGRWNHTIGSWRTLGNQANYQLGTATEVRCASVPDAYNFSIDNMYAEALIANNSPSSSSKQVGTAVRISADRRTYYTAFWSNSTLYLFTCLNGTFTLITSKAYAQSLALNQVIRTDVQDDVVKCFMDGNEELSGINGVISGNLAHGLFATNSAGAGYTVDDYKGGDYLDPAIPIDPVLVAQLANRPNRWFHYWDR